MQRRAGVGDIVRDKHSLAGEVCEVGLLADQDRLRQSLTSVGVELHVHVTHILDVQGIGDTRGDEETTPHHSQDRVGDPVVIDECLREVADAHTEVRVVEDLEFRLGRHRHD